jgi:hypothetical protein
MFITLDQFKKTLSFLKEKNIHLKVKTNAGWTNNYLHIIGFITSSEDQFHNDFKGIVLSNMNETEGILINNISTVCAFELEQACEDLNAKTVYKLDDQVFFKALILN